MGTEPIITLASTTETQDELDHATSENWRTPFDPEKAKVDREEREKTEAAAAAEAAKKTDGSAPAEKRGTAGESEPEEDEEDLPKGARKRIDNLTKRFRTAEEENRKLQSRLEALEKGKEPEKAAPVVKQDAEPQKKDFRDPDEWVKAHGLWAAREVARQNATKAEADEADAHTAEVFESHLGRTREFRAEHPDFDEKVDASTTSFSEAVAIAIVEADNGPAVAYHLAEHPEELEKIAKMSRARQVMEIGRISASLLPAESKEGTTTTTTRSTTPTPITKVKTTKASTPVTSLADLAANDPDEFIRKRNQQEREAKRRR